MVSEYTWRPHKNGYDYADYTVLEVEDPELMSHFRRIKGYKWADKDYEYFVNKKPYYPTSIGRRPKSAAAMTWHLEAQARLRKEEEDAESKLEDQISELDERRKLLDQQRKKHQKVVAEAGEAAAPPSPPQEEEEQS